MFKYRIVFLLMTAVIFMWGGMQVALGAGCNPFCYKFHGVCFGCLCMPPYDCIYYQHVESTSLVMGSNVTVSLRGEIITATFSNVVSPGDVSLTESPWRPAKPPDGFIFRGVTYDISTTASYFGDVAVTLKYNDTGLSATREQNLELFHWENNRWVDTTTSVDTANNRVTGSVSTLSPFVVGVSSIPAGYSSPWLLLTAVSVTGSCLYLFFRRKKRLIRAEI